MFAMKEQMLLNSNRKLIIALIYSESHILPYASVFKTLKILRVHMNKEHNELNIIYN